MALIRVQSGRKQLSGCEQKVVRGGAAHRGHRECPGRLERWRHGLTHPPQLCHLTPRGQAGGVSAAAGRGLAPAGSVLAASRKDKGAKHFNLSTRSVLSVPLA
jgi:hypothetical protein